MKARFDPRLYLVTDRGLACVRPIEVLVEAAVRGGVTAVQLREKDCSPEEFFALALRLKAGLDPGGIPLIVNDSVEIAARAGAAGVHLGRGDVPPAEARRVLGPDAVIGLSVETVEQAEAARPEDVDYLGVGPIFPTPTKPGAGAAWGPRGLAPRRARTRFPLVAIGGLNASNAEAVLAAGADGLAVVSAICSAPEPETAARDLRRIIDLFFAARPPAAVSGARE